ncbi:MAG: recombinase RecT [Vicinamibacterales bacterium]|jgi:recombination protein RecT|nr:recombinase RecT [Vicinamibacterales bacterium]MCU0477173.1 recombinase RecT [Chloroflexota bacterium]MCU0562320.1 recombinase RecT [Desulfobacterales bacterium]
MTSVTENKALQVARDNYVAVRQEISDKATSELAKLLPPDKAERFVAIGLRSLAKNPDLLTATPKSLTNAFYDAAVLGLEPVLGSVYFVKYGTEATMLIGYRGLVELAKRGDPDIEDIYGQVVYEGDEFSVEYGDAPRLHHRPDLYRQVGDPTKVTHTYAIAFRRNARPTFLVRTREEIEAIRARSRAKNSGPWVTDWAAMAQKTAVRALCSQRLSLSAEIREALDRDADREYGLVEPVAAPQSKTITLKEQLREKAQTIVVEGEEVPAEAIVNIEEVAEGAPVVLAPTESAPERTKCSDLSPYEDGLICDRPPQHPGSHWSGIGKDKVAW